MQASITAYQNVPNPAGTTPSGFYAKLFKDDQEIVSQAKIAPESGEVAFSVTQGGVYFVTMQRRGADGTALGPAVASNSVTVSPTISAPLTVNLSL